MGLRMMLGGDKAKAVRKRVGGPWWLGVQVSEAVEEGAVSCGDPWCEQCGWEAQERSWDEWSWDDVVPEEPVSLFGLALERAVMERLCGKAA